jgi:protein-tyrosine-phosphatase
MSLLFLFAAFLAAAPAEGKAVPLHATLEEYVAARTAEFEQIPPERRQQLAEISDFVRTRVAAGQPALLTFICTHNSRRSHIAQIWAHVAAAHYGIGHVQTFSGGTEATAFNARAVEALKRAGFAISSADSLAKSNPHYQVSYASAAAPLRCFSKVYTDESNPQRDFCAVMTCSQADQACPLVPGAALRVALPYDDPKAFDGTPQEAHQYDERCRQIAREMLFAFSMLKR